MTTTASLRALVEERSVIVCCGTGGVGKTSCAAALALSAARSGRRAVVVTIDPARRLADALALPEMGNEAHDVPRDRWDPSGDAPATGHLTALMLDARSTFDALVREQSGDDAQAERILANRFYRNVAGALSGTQEYMAAEKLYELHESAAYDVVVVDTPPTRHALDFLDAPGRLTRLLDHWLFRALMAPTRTGVRMAAAAVRAAITTIGTVVGREVVDDVTAFFRAFEGLESGFRARAHRVTELLAEPSTAFVLVTSPRDAAVAEAEFFARHLRARGLRISALVVNRVHPEFGRGGNDRGTELGARIAGEAPGAVRDALTRLEARYEYLDSANRLARRERDRLGEARRAIDAPATSWIPSLPQDIVDFAALDALAGHLLADGVG